MRVSHFTQGESVGLILAPSIAVLAKHREEAEECAQPFAGSQPRQCCALLHGREPLAHPFHGGFRRRIPVSWQSCLCCSVSGGSNRINSVSARD